MGGATYKGEGSGSKRELMQMTPISNSCI